MDDKELMICLMKEYFELKNQIKSKKKPVNIGSGNVRG